MGKFFTIMLVSGGSIAVGGMIIDQALKWVPSNVIPENLKPNVRNGLAIGTGLAIMGTFFK